MRRDPRAFLWKVCDSANAIMTFVRDRRWEDYRNDRMLRSAVERQFEIIGEALRGLSASAPEIATRIPDLPQIIAFRNILIHGYATIDDCHGVRQAIHEDLPGLARQSSDLLRELGDTPGSTMDR